VADATSHDAHDDVVRSRIGNEHRLYGYRRPGTSSNYDTRRRRHCTSYQALACLPGYHTARPKATGLTALSGAI
jgi:hypothetical protein